jgi:endoglucanase
MKVALRRLLGVGLVLASAGCGADGDTSSPTTPAEVPQFSLLQASGQRIVSAAGEPVRLRGLNLGGWLVKEGYMLHLPGPRYDAPSEIDAAILDLAGPELGNELLIEYRERFITEDDLAEIRQLGFNSVRLPLHWVLLWDLDRGGPREDGLRLLDRVVEWCEERELWLFFDLHCAPGGQNHGNISDSDGVARLYLEPDLQEATVGVWEAIARRYRGRVAVGGYDLLNEPVWEPGSDVARFFDRLTEAVRHVDDTHLIVLEGNTWATDFTIFGPPQSRGLVYSFHKYWDANDEASIREYLSFSDRWDVPLWLGETGENDGRWYAEMFALAKRHELGWCFWPWKKVRSDNCPLSVDPPPGTWSLVTQYLDGRGPRPSPEEAATALRAMLDAARPGQARRNAAIIQLLQEG